MLIKLQDNFVTEIDDADYPKIADFKWSAYRVQLKSRDLYYAQASTTKNGRKSTVKMHRLILGVTPGTLIDHRDGNGLNNRRLNLRIASRPQNEQNGSKRPCRMGKACISQYKGVSKYKHAPRKWRAYIVVNGHQKHLGTFDSEEKAARAYDTAAKKDFGQFAKTNF